MSGGAAAPAGGSATADAVSPRGTALRGGTGVVATGKIPTAGGAGRRQSMECGVSTTPSKSIAPTSRPYRGPSRRCLALRGLGTRSL